MCVAGARGLHDTEDAWYGIGKRPKLFWDILALIVRKALMNQEDDAFGTRALNSRQTHWSDFIPSTADARGKMLPKCFGHFVKGYMACLMSVIEACYSMQLHCKIWQSGLCARDSHVEPHQMGNLVTVNIGFKYTIIPDYLPLALIA